MAGIVLLMAIAGEPQCPTDYTSCLNKLVPELRTYTDDWIPFILFKFQEDKQYNLWCNSTTWMAHDYCYTLCPMRLVITDPPHLRMWFCAEDNTFEPYSPDGHIDLHHPLNKKEMELVAAGNPNKGNSRNGCSPSDYTMDNKTYDGKIVLSRRGTCPDTQAAKNAKAAGGAMLFVVGFWPYYLHEYVVGSSEGLENFPTMYAARHDADYILDALDQGVKVKGMFQYECNDMPEGLLDNPQDYPWDYCGHAELAVYGTCKTPDVEIPEPMCEVCTLKMILPNGAGTLCVYGAELLPRKKEILMDWSDDFSLPYTTQKDEVVFTNELPNLGCSPSDYVGLKDKIILVPEVWTCPLYQTVRHAQQAGVKAKAYIMVSEVYWLEVYRMRGLSTSIHIPVHTLDYHSKTTLQEIAGSGRVRHLPGIGYAMDPVIFERGERPETPAPTPAPLELAVDNSPTLDTSADFEITGGNVACIVVICFNVVALVGLFLKQRSEAIVVPDQVRPERFSIPLKVASMGLSLTLLVVIAVVSFTLVKEAGEDSTDRAMESGRTAVSLAYNSSGMNTITLSDQIRENLINRVLALLEKKIHEMEYQLTMLETAFFGYDSTFTDFESRHLFVARMVRRADDKEVFQWFQVFTTRGFYMGAEFIWFWMTDNRPDSLRQDGVVGSVAETNEGWRYGVNKMSMNYGSWTWGYEETVPPYQFNASRILAGNVGDPLSVTNLKPQRHTTWMTGRVQFPVHFHGHHPISAFRPLYPEPGRYEGALEVHEDFTHFIKGALDSSLSTGAMEGMSVMVIDNTDKAILGLLNVGTTESKEEGMVNLDKMHTFKGLYYMHLHPSVNVTAFANYMDAVDGWMQHEGEFDQKQYFTDQPHVTELKITASGGRAVDESPGHWNVEMRDGGCRACVVQDDQLGKEVLQFDGSALLHVYRNMTRQTPVVAMSRVSANGEPWRSRYESFSETLTYGDGTECVSRTWRPTPTQAVPRCLLRTDYFYSNTFTLSMRIRPDEVYDDASPQPTTPRLFSDAVVGEANFRLFANGQLFLFVIKYGCRTKPFEGGFPVRSWTTITATAGGGRCRVYINGTLYSEGVDGRSIGGGRVHANPYTAGRNFKGRIDSIQLFRESLYGNEVASLHTEDKLVRHVKSKTLFAQTKSLDMNGPFRDGVRWSVAVMIPRAEIMHEVDANRMKTLRDVQIEEHNTNKELRQRANATIMIIVAIATTAVVVFLLFNNFLTRPFEQTAAIMADAAMLRIESIPGTLSLITELATMNTAMQLMLENLKLYKSFMPQSIQLEVNSTDEDEWEDRRSKGTEDPSSHSHHSSRSQRSSSSSVCARSPRHQVLGTLQKKHFSYMVLNVRKWHKTIRQLPDPQVMLLHSHLLGVVLKSTLSHKGVSEVFSGDRFASSFNAAKAALQHPNRALQCALECSREVLQYDMVLTGAVASGDGRVGNMGTEVMRRFSFMSPTISWSYALERFACSRELCIVIDSMVQREVEHLCIVRLVDAIIFPKVSDKQIVVYDAVKAKDLGGGDEWMYELKHGEENDPMRLWNDCALKIINQDYTVCHLFPRTVWRLYCFLSLRKPTRWSSFLPPRGTTARRRCDWPRRLAAGHLHLWTWPMSDACDVPQNRPWFGELFLLLLFPIPILPDEYSRSGDSKQ